MPMGTSTKTVADVIAFTKRQFGDESGVQITDADIIRWVNQGQMEIVNKNPMIQATASTNSFAGQAAYSVPVDIIHIESILFDEVLLQGMSYERALSDIGSAQSQSGTPYLWYTWRDIIYLWPVPDSAKQIQVNYSREPTPVASTTDKLSVPDRYFDRVCEYVNSKAYELDEDWQAHGVQRQSFEDKLLEDTNAQLVINGAFFVAKDSEYE